MNKNLASIFFLCIILFSCRSSNTAIVPVPPDEYFIHEEKVTIDIYNITETKDGASVRNLPFWLSAFINGGINEVEKNYIYADKYVFVGVNEGINPGALNMWAENFSVVHGLTLLSAERIQRRMILGASLYPDDEYGAFFETMIKHAYSAVYPGAVKESTYWVKLDMDTDIYYYYFVLLTIDKLTMQNIINGMMDETYSSAAPAGSQRNSVDRLRRTFFDNF